MASAIKSITLDMSLKYPDDFIDKAICGDNLSVMPLLPDECVDLIPTDPPYGIEFMGKDWDKAIPPIETWKECLRVLKPGAFAFVMCIPRQDCLSRMIISLEDAGFNVNFTPLFWTFASGFPKAQNIGKRVDKRGSENEKYLELTKELCDYLKHARKKLGVSTKDIANAFPSKTGGLTGCVWNWENGTSIPTMEQWNKLKGILKLDNEKFIELIERAVLRREEAKREVIGQKEKLNAYSDLGYSSGIGKYEKVTIDVSIPATLHAKVLAGSYAGFQPKPAVEVIIVAMKPLSEKTYVDQALANRKGATWLDDCRIAYKTTERFEGLKNPLTHQQEHKGKVDGIFGFGDGINNIKRSTYNNSGRFPANLICSDDVLNDGRNYGSTTTKNRYGGYDNKLGNALFSFGSEAKERERVIGGIGSFSRYFSLDAWWSEKIKQLPKAVQKTFPFLIVPKASKSEKNKGLGDMSDKLMARSGGAQQAEKEGKEEYLQNHIGYNRISKVKNDHPTVKPIKLGSYLITLGSRAGDVVLDPFCGSGSFCISAYNSSRHFIGIEKDKSAHEIAKARVKDILMNMQL